MHITFFSVMHAAVERVMSNSALITVLRQEMDRYNNLLFIIETSLKELILAIKGEVIMSEPLEEAYNAILSQKVPQRWKVSGNKICCAKQKCFGSSYLKSNLA